MMHRNFLATLINRLAAYLGLLFMMLCNHAAAHGGVMIEEDLCIIKFGFYKAHFTIYQPLTSRDREFCEDLPDPGPTIFVMNYLHNSLSQVPVDFRIIRDITGLGRFAKWEDLEKIENLDSYSVFYQSPALRPEGVLMVEHEFDEAGDYIGIVTAGHPSKETVYRAVFPFQVGNRKFFNLLIASIIVGLVLLQVRFRIFNLLIDGIKGGGKKNQ
jgi:hypothetical protein